MKEFKYKDIKEHYGILTASVCSNTLLKGRGERGVFGGLNYTWRTFNKYSEEEYFSSGFIFQTDCNSNTDQIKQNGVNKQVVRADFFITQTDSCRLFITGVSGEYRDRFNFYKHSYFIHISLKCLKAFTSCL